MVWSSGFLPLLFDDAYIFFLQKQPSMCLNNPQVHGSAFQGGGFEEDDEDYDDNHGNNETMTIQVYGSANSEGC